MDRIYKMMKRNNKGFTLVELMVVLLIIGILVAIAIPIYNNVQKDAANKAHASNMRTLLGAAQQALAVDGDPNDDVTWTNIKSAGTNPKGKHKASDYISEWPKIPAKADTNPGFAANTFTEGHNNYKVVIKTTGEITVGTVGGS